MEFLYLFLLGVSTSFFSLPLSIKLGRIFNIYDYPNKRKSQKKPVLRIGGLGIVLSFYVSLFIVYKVSINFLNNDLFNNSDVIVIIFPFFIFVLGLLDDKFSISPFLRLFFQILISIFVWFQGIRIEAIEPNFLSLEPIILFKSISLIVTVFWLAGMTNAINWIDGSNGLAGGISLISLISITIISLLNNSYETAILSILLAGTLIGFLYFNLKPNRVMMGDSGSNFLGFTLGLLSLIASSKAQYDGNINFETITIVPVLLFFLPIFDMVRILILRVINGDSPFSPDMRHFHHFLLKNGCSVLETFYIFCLITILSNSLTIFLILENNIYKVSMILVFLVCLFSIKKIMNKNKLIFKNLIRNK